MPFGKVNRSVLKGEEDAFIRDAITNCEWDFYSEIWKERSSEVKDLITRLLVKDPKKRLSPMEIQSHPWFELFQ